MTRQFYSQLVVCFIAKALWENVRATAGWDNSDLLDDRKVRDGMWSMISDAT